jgi:hypothetical protein
MVRRKSFIYKGIKTTSFRPAIRVNSTIRGATRFRQLGHYGMRMAHLRRNPKSEGQSSWPALTIAFHKPKTKRDDPPSHQLSRYNNWAVTKTRNIVAAVWLLILEPNTLIGTQRTKLRLLPMILDISRSLMRLVTIFSKWSMVKGCWARACMLEMVRRWSLKPTITSASNRSTASTSC